MPFDIQAARQAGKTDEQIASYLGQSLGFDVDSAVRSGKTPTQIAEYLSKNDAPPVITPEIAPPEKQGFWSSVGTDIAKRYENARDVFTKNNDAGGSVYGSFKKIPSGVLQVSGQVAGLVNDVALEGGKAVYRALVPESTQKAIESGVESFMAESPGIRKDIQRISDAYGVAKETFPEGMRNLEAVANIAAAVPVIKGAAATGGAVKNVGKEAVNIVRDVSSFATSQSAGELQKKAREVIRYGIEKGIRPGVAKQGTAKLSEDYLNRAEDAVKNIIANKDNLVLTDYHGNVINGELPKSLKQFSDAVDQTKRRIFNQYDDLTKKAGEAGAQVSLDPIVKALESEAGNVVLQDTNRGIANYAKNQAKIFEKRGFYTAQQAQDAIATYNSSLEAFYKNPNPNTAHKARIDAIIVKNLRKSLDDTIENAVGDGYQELKNAYGSLKTIEKDLAHRAVVDARKNVKGLVDFADIFTSGELLAGIATMNPKMVIRAGAWKAMKEYFKMINNPNYIVKDMFKNVEHIVEQGKGGFKSKTIQKMATPTQSLQMGP